MLYFKSKDLERNICSTLTQLWNKEDFMDITLATEDGQQIRAHKTVLISASSYFQKVFDRHSYKDMLIYLKDINYKSLKMIIEFIYTGQCDVGKLDLIQFFSAGKLLKVTGLLGNLEKTEIYHSIADNSIIPVQKAEFTEPREENNYNNIRYIATKKYVEFNTRSTKKKE